MPYRKKTKVITLGKNLMNTRNEAAKSKHKNSKRHAQDLGDGYDYATFSVTEENNLTEFFLNAELNKKQYQAERQNIELINPATVGLLHDSDLALLRKKHKENLKCLRVPRRPNWIGGMTPKELEEMEYNDFMEWRKELADISENKGLMLTPFEKNLEFWRQLWRVLERSDIIVQILDARNPLLFYCEDIFTYIKEISPNKIPILLLNKADYLTYEQRKYWAEYFDGIGIKALFFSALEQTNDAKKVRPASDDEDENESDRESIKNKKLETINDRIF